MTSARELLATPMARNDADAATIGDYLVKLLAELWQEKESFSGKRPFGNSSWEYDLYAALVRAGHVAGTFDDEDDLDSLDRFAADALIAECIAALNPAA